MEVLTHSERKVEVMAVVVVVVSGVERKRDRQGERAVEFRSLPFRGML